MDANCLFGIGIIKHYFCFHLINLDQINKCLINLPERTDRYERSMDEIADFFVNHEVNFHKGIREEPVYKGIAQAHMNCIALAKQKGWPVVLIMEDDIKFQSKNSRKYADEAFKNIPDDWDILLSSVYRSKELKSVNDHWYKTKEFCGATFYLVHQKAYDRILAFDKSTHIDRAMVGKLNLNCYVVNQFFCIQYPGLSDNTGKEQDYNYMISKKHLLK